MRSVQNRRQFLQLAAASWLAGRYCVAEASEQKAATSFPSKPLTIIVPATPGGIVDFVARQLAQELPALLGQSVVVENKPGGGQIIGVQALLNAPADGHTLFIGSLGSNGTNYALYSDLPYKPSDMVGIAYAISTPLVLVVHPDLPAQTVPELVALAKTKPGSLSIATSGNGTSSHFASVLLGLQTGVETVTVPYGGSTPARTDLMGGQVQLMFDQPVSALPQIQSGRLRPIGMTSRQRSPLFPEVPTVAESGYPDFEVTTWVGVVASSKVPRPVIDRLHTEIVKVLAMPHVKRAITQGGGETPSMTPKQFDAFMASEIEKWAEVVQKAKIQVR